MIRTCWYAQVECVMSCSAAMPWPMQSSVEAVMVQEGRTTVGKYLDFAKEACEEDRSNRTAESVSGRLPSGGAPPRVSAARGTSFDTELEETFFDVEETSTQSSGGASFEAGGMTGPEPTLVPYEALDRGEAVLRCLLQIHASCSETAALMRQMQQSLQRMDENIGAIRSAAVTATKARRTSTADGLDGEAGPRRSAGGYSWMYLMCMGIAGASAASVIIIRARQRSDHVARS